MKSAFVVTVTGVLIGLRHEKLVFSIEQQLCEPVANGLPADKAVVRIHNLEQHIRAYLFQTYGKLTLSKLVDVTIEVTQPGILKNSIEIVWKLLPGKWRQWRDMN